MTFLHILSFLLGIALVIVTLFSVIETFVLPRSASDPIARTVFRSVRALFNIRMRFAHTYLEKDRVMAFFAPVSLLALLPVWSIIILIGYAGMFWGVSSSNLTDAFQISGSSLFTLGIAVSRGPVQMILELSEAVIGLIVITLLIAYLPTMYAAFSRRESAVTLLEVRAGSPPSVTQMLGRYHRIHGLPALGEQWRSWEVWFADIEESHTSLAALVFFRSPQPHHSWVIAAGAVLDTASVTLAVVDIPHDPQADLCIRSGFLALRRISDFFNILYNPDPHYPTDPISITRTEFDSVCEELASIGVPLKPDREQAWKDFAGWRVNYDYVLLSLSNLTMAPVAPWTSDRAPVKRADSR